MSVTVVCDATGENVSHLPKGQVAGYSTGTGVVPWTTADWDAHPGAVRIDQDPAASDPTADVLDVENGAATPQDAPGWAKRAMSDYKSAARPGQRSPAIYCSQSNVTTVANALVNGGVTSGVGLWVADWTDSSAQGIKDINDASGPFPIIGMQYENAGEYDISVVSSTWLANVSVKESSPHYSVTKLPPGQWEGMITLSGTGTDGNGWHTTTDNGKAWSTPRKS